MTMTTMMIVNEIGGLIYITDAIPTDKYNWQANAPKFRQ